MARYIDADKLSPDCMFNKNGTKGFAISQSQVANAPTADVQPVKHGHWVNCKAGFYHSFGECSECGQGLCIDTWLEMNMKYCPKCGAKMDKEN